MVKQNIMHQVIKHIFVWFCLEISLKSNKISFRFNHLDIIFHDLELVYCIKAKMMKNYGFNLKEKTFSDYFFCD